MGLEWEKHLGKGFKITFPITSLVIIAIGFFIHDPVHWIDLAFDLWAFLKAHRVSIWLIALILFISSYALKISLPESQALNYGLAVALLLASTLTMLPILSFVNISRQTDGSIAIIPDEKAQNTTKLFDLLNKTKRRIDWECQIVEEKSPHKTPNGMYGILKEVKHKAYDIVIIEEHNPFHNLSEGDLAGVLNKRTLYVVTGPSLVTGRRTPNNVIHLGTSIIDEISLVREDIEKISPSDWILANSKDEMSNHASEFLQEVLTNTPTSAPHLADTISAASSQIQKRDAIVWLSWKDAPPKSLTASPSPPSPPGPRLISVSCWARPMAQDIQSNALKLIVETHYSNDRSLDLTQTIQMIDDNLRQKQLAYLSLKNGLTHQIR